MQLTSLIPCTNDREVSAALDDGGVGGVELQTPNVAIKVPSPAGIKNISFCTKKMCFVVNMLSLF